MLSLDELNITIDIFKSIIDKVSVEIINSSIENINNSYIYGATIRQKPIDKKQEPIYDDKYLEKFKTFPNEFKFSDLELEIEKNYFDELKANKENT